MVHVEAESAPLVADSSGLRVYFSDAKSHFEELSRVRPPETAVFFLLFFSKESPLPPFFPPHFGGSENLIWEL